MEALGLGSPLSWVVWVRQLPQIARRGCAGESLNLRRRWLSAALGLCRLLVDCSASVGYAAFVMRLRWMRKKGMVVAVLWMPWMSVGRSSSSSSSGNCAFMPTLPRCSLTGRGARVVLLPGCLLKGR